MDALQIICDALQIICDELQIICDELQIICNAFVYNESLEHLFETTQRNEINFPTNCPTVSHT